MTATQLRAPDAPILPSGVRTVRVGGASLRVHLRSAILTIIVLAAALGMAWWSLIVGTAGLTVGDVLDAMLGRADAATTRIVIDWRLPRIAFALLAGAALAVSGAIFQSITRNPLGSPDIIGFSVRRLHRRAARRVVRSGRALRGHLDRRARRGTAHRRGGVPAGVQQGRRPGLRIIVVGIGI